MRPFFGPPHVEVSRAIASPQNATATQTMVVEYFKRIGRVHEATPTSLVATTGSFRNTMGAGARRFPARWEIQWAEEARGSEVTVVVSDDLRIFGRRIPLKAGSQRSYERSIERDIDDLRQHLSAEHP